MSGGGWKPYFVIFITCSIGALLVMSVGTVRSLIGKDGVKLTPGERIAVLYLLVMDAISAVMMFWERYNG